MVSLANYPAEPGTNQCGASWSRSLTVTGKLAHANFGSTYREVLAPLASKSQQFGRDLDDERSLRDELETRAGNLSHRAQTSQWISSAQREGILALLGDIDTRQSEITQIYRKWDHYPCFPDSPQNSTVCPWPLGMDDNPAAWRPQCGTPHSPETIFHGQLDGQAFRCPSPAGAGPLAASQRPADRSRVVTLMHEILQRTRCAQYVLTRLELHAQAWQDFHAHHMSPGGLQAEPTAPTPHTPSSGFGFGTAPKPLDPLAQPPKTAEPLNPVIPSAPFDPAAIPSPFPGEFPPQTPEGAQGAPASAPSDAGGAAKRAAIGFGIGLAAAFLLIPPLAKRSR